MLHPLPLTTLLLTLLTTTTTSAAFRTPSDAVLLSTVKSLTLHANKPTTHRRVPSIPQLKCVGGSARGLYEPDTLRCKNSGSSYSSADVQWTCTASLPPEFKLGSTEVICEGYSGPEDEYVLKGSCGVEYRLVLTSKGEEVYGKRKWDAEAIGDTWAPRIFWIIFSSVVAWMIYAAFFRDRRLGAPAGGRADGGGGGWGGWGGGGGGGGGGGANDDNDTHGIPPPPYTPRAKPYPSSSAQPAQSWRPGFWTGAATGAAASYLSGRGGGVPRQQPQNSWGGWGGGGVPRQQQQGGWGGWGGGGRYDNGEGSSSSGGGRSGGAGSSAYSGSRYQSSGFGGTSRR